MGNLQKRVWPSGAITFRAVVRLKGFPRQEASFERKTDASKWIQATEAAIREGRYFPSTKLRRKTVGDLIDRYVSTAFSRKPKSETKQRQQLAYWKKRIGAYSLRDLTPSLVAEVKEELLASETRYGKKYSGATVNRYLAALSHACTIACNEWEWMPHNPVTKVSKTPESPGRTRYLSDEERNKLLKACKESKSEYLYIAVVLGLSTGARMMEIQGMIWKQVDLERRIITLPPSKTKNKKARSLPLVGLAFDLLNEHSKVRKLHTDFVFPSTNGKKPMDMNDAWKQAVKRAGIKDFRYHDLRHSAASYLAMGGATLPEIAEILGHSSFHMVKRYAHLSTEHTAKVVASMNKKIFGAL